MTKKVEVELATYPSTVTVNSISRKFGAIYEISETRQWFAPNKVTTSRISRFLCADAE